MIAGKRLNRYLHNYCVMRNISFYLTHPKKTLFYIFITFSHFLPDRLHLKLLYRFEMGKNLDLDNPQTFCEKLQWLKLYNRKAEYTTMVDKLAVKKYVTDKIGSQYVIPVLGVWERPEDIDFESLPERFVLKTTNGGGGEGVYICKDKRMIDKREAIRMMSHSMKADIYKARVEWAYKNVPKRIFAEQYMEDKPDVADLPDYKWYCFNGSPTFCQVIKDRSSKETIDFFDTDWNHQEFVGLNPNVTHAQVLPERPAHLETQIHIAKELSKDIPFSRIDLYEINNKVYFGEITLYPASGIGKFRPEQYDQILGQLLVLPEDKHC